MEDNIKKNENPEPRFEDVQTYIHQGKREYQEDYCDWDEDYLIVADGVGGLAKGDVASKLVVTHTAEFIEKGLPNIEDIEDWAQNLTNHITAALNEYAANQKETYGMGSTMVLALRIGDYLAIIHVGDSRVYHFSKNGELKWGTKDHSLVQELIDAKIITEEEAETHPKRNVITRVLQAKDKKAPKPSVTVIHNFSKGDKLLLCTDGVTESWNRKGLARLINATSEENLILLREIENYAVENSSDNNTAILATIGWTGTSKSVVLPGAATAAGNPSKSNEHSKTSDNASSASANNKSKYRYLIFVSFFLITVFGIYWAGNYFTSTEDESSQEPTDQRDELNKNEESVKPAEPEKGGEQKEKTEEQSSENPKNLNSSPSYTDTTSTESDPPPEPPNNSNENYEPHREEGQNEEIGDANSHQYQKKIPSDREDILGANLNPFYLNRNRGQATAHPPTQKVTEEIASTMVRIPDGTVLHK